MMMPLFAYWFTAALLIGMLASMELGRRLARARTDAAQVTANPGVSALDGAVYALFGLLLAFIFSGATSRFDERRELIVREANAIGTAYLRLDLLPADAQATLRPLFRRYVESRLATFRSAGDPTAWAAENRRDQRLQNEIWAQVVAGVQRTASPSIYNVVLPPLNDMIDLATTRLVASRTHPPPVIYGMLLVLALASSLLSGIAMAASAKRPWPHILAFALTIASTVYGILDIEYPRLGFVRVDAADQVLVELLETLR